VEAAGASRGGGGTREGEGAPRKPTPTPSPAARANPRDSVARHRLARDHAHVLALAHELARDLPRDVLDTTGARTQTFDDEGDAQGGLLGSGPNTVSTRPAGSMRGRPGSGVGPRAEPLPEPRRARCPQSGPVAGPGAGPAREHACVARCRPGIA